ncbi:MAG TPA: PEP/pyruvate-binding domain-containing protein [Bacteriovoracaceae bacterium]|nr:PEP/pyruvate-binding domain-containing protein [Bacteriovoracaceae bacterium]
MKLNQVGGKAYNLHLLLSSGINVPAFQVVTADTFERFNNTLFNSIPAELNETTYIDFEKVLETHFSMLFIDPDARASIGSVLPGPTIHFAVRSSGTEEDGALSSFAGQFESYLFVKADSIFEKVLACWRSRFSFRALSYIRNKEVSERFPLAVIIQVMVPAEKSGVMLTANVDQQEPFQTVISATYGIGEGIVSGECEADAYVLSQEGQQLIRQDLVSKVTMLVHDEKAQGLKSSEVSAHLRDMPVLNDPELKHLGLMALKIEQDRKGIPQDIEWCFYNGSLFILQTRPLTSWPGLHKTSKLELWDSSNIGESYHGSVSPMTFSFSRENYHNLFKALLKDLGCSRDSLERSEVHLENLLGQYQGHLYYRLSHWKKLLVPLPGGPVFMKFLSSFIGSSSETGSDSNKNAGMEIINACQVVLKIIYRYSFRKVFTASFEKKYAAFSKIQWKRLDSGLNEKQILDSIRSFYDELFGFWFMPTYNDFFSVVAVGLFDKFVAFVFSNRPALERNEIKLNLIGASKGLGPIVELKKLVELLKSYPELGILVKNTDIHELTKLWSKHDIVFENVRVPFQEFLDQWGFRCEDELMLEATDLKEDPTKFFEQLQMHLTLPETTSVRSQEKLLPEGPKERLLLPLLNALATRTMEHLDTRESMRIKRSELFAIMRRYLKGLGNILSPEYLDHPMDIFYLHLEEVRTLHKQQFRALIASRKLTNSEEAPERFYFDSVNVIIPRKIVSNADGISGTPCFGGLVQGEIVIYEKGMNVSDMKDKILITERSGPGHVAYFPHIKAMIVEKGSTLSHAVIAAREFGLPTIVGVPDLCLKMTGVSIVEVNANTGQVLIITYG